jgi:hypothetical protein
MSQSAETMREISRWILESEIGDQQGNPEIAKAIEAAFERINNLLSNVVGRAGFQALLERSVAITKRELAGLQNVDVRSEPSISMNGLVPLMDRGTAAVATDISVAMLANLLSLLSSFISEDLTMRLLRRVWTTLPEGGPTSGSKGTT